VIAEGLLEPVLGQVERELEQAAQPPAELGLLRHAVPDDRQEADVSARPPDLVDDSRTLRLRSTTGTPTAGRV
jgi:hypothetical protein